jgi:hypothetical protein
LLAAFDDGDASGELGEASPPLEAVDGEDGDDVDDGEDVDDPPRLLCIE